MSKLEIALFFHLLGALLFVAVGAVDVLGFGLWLVDIKGVGYDAGWIQAALGLYALALILGAAGQLCLRRSGPGHPRADGLQAAGLTGVGCLGRQGCANRYVVR